MIARIQESNTKKRRFASLGLFMVDFRITWTLPISEVSKPRLLGLEKSGLSPVGTSNPVGAVSNRTE